MRRPDRTFDPFSESPVDGVIAAHCSVRVISGQFLTDRKVGTYVEVEMYGLPTDTIRKEHRTKVIAANGLNPVYAEAPFVFRKVVLPELAVLRFAVYDENGKQLGQRILPLDGLQAGYRHISLRSDTNQVPAKTNAAKSKILQKTNGSAANLLNEKENPPSSARSDGNLTSTGSSKLNNEATPAPVDKFKVEPIEVDDLKKDKLFAKLLKKFQKESEELKKKHQKQRDSIQKQQVRSLVNVQTDEWSAMMRRHEAEEFELRKSQLREQTETLRKLLLEAQKAQMQGLKLRLENETKELKQTQTKKSMEDAKILNLVSILSYMLPVGFHMLSQYIFLQDKGIKTKAERERRLKELHEKNLKMFVEERKRLAKKYVELQTF
ncbi:C2 domain protein [Ancylostoma ceylanicum]|uniref:phosphoinositide phospholipase C n=1 Tax=Ancylostoma ceylanicum TaxID=53326 RepID=A0A0D6LAL6_9BILA|nr:C2 domain protein [Ancylostoma ceylanicum]